MNEPFSDEQLDNLRQSYAGIATIDPLQPTYQKMCDQLDAMNDAMLIQIADAGIKFLSPMAINRVARRGIQRSHTWAA